MTTSLALTTHGWPVEVTTTDSFAPSNGIQTTTKTVERIERWQIRHLVVTDTRSISVRELTSEGWQDNPNAEPPAGTPLTADELAANAGGDETVPAPGA